MKVLYVQGAKATWLFDTRLINPLGLELKSLFTSLKDRYEFAKAPAHEHERSDKGAFVFSGGFFAISDEKLSVSLTVFRDGIVAESASNTGHATAFLEDLRDFSLGIGYSIPPPSSISKGFSSTLVLETDVELLRINPKLLPLIQFIQSKLVSLDGKPREFEFSRIAFASEDLSKPFAPTAFTFERRLEQPFSANRYYSEAPLQTNEHIELLDKLEAILKA
jgi:hypothetical protein